MLKRVPLAVPRALAFIVMFGAASAGATEPMDVLRDNVDRGVTILKDPQYLDASRKTEQRDRLCDVAHEMFDPFLFSKLVLASNWDKFSSSEQSEFVDAFAAYLCTFYLSKLQERYSDENVVFLGQEYRNDSMALVKVEVDWENVRVPIEIRMARREGRWKAFDAVVSGVSAVVVYRAQLKTALDNGTPADLIRELRTKVAADG